MCILIKIDILKLLVFFSVLGILLNLLSYSFIDTHVS